MQSRTAQLAMGYDPLSAVAHAQDPIHRLTPFDLIAFHNSEFTWRWPPGKRLSGHADAATQVQVICHFVFFRSVAVRRLIRELEAGLQVLWFMHKRGIPETLTS